MIIVGIKPQNNLISWGIRLASKLLTGHDALASHVILLLPEMNLVAEWLPSQSHLFYMEPDVITDFLNELKENNELAWHIEYSKDYRVDAQYLSSNLNTAPMCHYCLTLIKSLLGLPTPLTNKASIVRPLYCTDIASLLFSEDYFLPEDRPLFPDEILDRAWKYPDNFDCTLYLVHSSELTNNFLYKEDND